MKNELRKYIRSVISENMHPKTLDAVGEYFADRIANEIFPEYEEKDRSAVMNAVAHKIIERYVSDTTSITSLLKMPNMNETAVEIDEERLTNPEGAAEARALNNFIVSHAFGEDLGKIGKMFVVFSYGSQFPLFIHYNKKWYENSDNYHYEGETVESTETHREDLRPTEDTIKKSHEWMGKLIKWFMRKNGISGLEHTETVPGVKN